MGTKRDELYVCSIEGEGKCDCIAEMLTDCDAVCSVSCCDKPMAKVEPKTSDQGQEKHVPVIAKVDGGYKVTVGSVPHPMEEKHFIQFVELRAEGEVQRKYLKPGQAPEAVFLTAATDVSAVEYCNLHGIWAGEVVVD